MNRRFISSIAAAAILSTGLLFTGCTTGTEAPAPKAKTEKHGKHAKFKNITFDEAVKIQENNEALFLDARGIKLYKKGTVMGAMHMDVKQFDKLKKYLPADKNVPLVSFCNGPKCHLSGKLAKALKAEGYTNISIYPGGGPEYVAKKKAMGLKKECKAKATGAYKPELPAIDVNGVKIHLLAEDGEANEDGIIDQFWFAEQIKNGTVPSGVTIVDVRKPERYNASHIKGAINVPFEDEKIDASKLPKDGIVVFYCNTGMKSTDARGVLSDELAERVFIFDATYKCDDANKNCKIVPNEPL
jgi:rhodanese-related sulfurtransferase